MSDYPEHDKMLAAKPAAEAAGDFAEWLRTKGIFLARTYMLDRDGNITDDEAACRRERVARTHEPLTDLLAEWQGIDLAKIEAEKRAMLARVDAEAGQ